MNFPPKITISAVVSGLKGSSSSVLYIFRPDIAIRYHQSHSCQLWCSFCWGNPIFPTANSRRKTHCM